jgi:ABC-type phosphate transport system substrate-binding protein
MTRTPEGRRRFGRAAWALLAAGAACAPRASESPTRGHLAIAVAESHAPILEREAALFDGLYADAHVTLCRMTTREAFIALIADSVRLVVVDRRPNAEEERALADVGARIEEVRIAEDALALLVNPANGLTTVSLEQAAQLLSGRTTDWSALPSSALSGPVAVVMTGRNSGAWELLTAHFFPGRDWAAPAVRAENQSEVLAQVAAVRGAVGVVSVACWKDPVAAAANPSRPAAAGWAAGVASGAPVRALAIAAADSLGQIEPRSLHQANIHLGLYPLHYPIYVVFNSRSLLAAGFSAFVASAPGQKLLLDAGLVPATMPVRLVQLSEVAR